MFKAMRLDFEFERLVSTRYRLTDRETGEVFICDLEIAKPGLVDQLWASGVRISPLETKWRPIYGVDAFQALQCAFPIADILLGTYRSEYDIEPWFEEP
jgi:hypothetical protein